MLKSFDILLGPPGAGKDTQAKLLADKFGYVVLPIGKTIRHLAKTNTKIAQSLEMGKLIDNRIVNEIVELELQQYSTTDRIISDGFPRCLPQAHWIEGHLSTLGNSISHVFWLNIDRSEARERLKYRGREDDEDSLVDQRFDIYEAQTIPVVNYFRQKNLVFEIDAKQNVEKVSQAIQAKLDNS